MIWILVLALSLRLPLMFDSLWLDESIQALALMGKLGPILDYALADFQPPLYHLILLPFTRLFGYSEFVLRTPSLLSGLGVVYFGSRLAGLLGKNAGKLAGLLLATNPLQIYYSAEGRTYMMTALFVTASFYYLFKLLYSSSSSRRCTIFYVLYTIMALWTSYLAWIVVVLQALYFLFTKNRRLLLASLISLATLVFWLPSLIHSLGIGLSTISHSPEWGRVVGGFSAKALALTWVKAVIGRVSFTPSWLYALVVLGLALVHGLALRSARTFRGRSLVVYLLLGTILVAATISLVIPVYSYFRLLFLVPLYLVLLALALSSRSRLLTSLVVAAQLALIGYYYLTPRFHHEAWRQVVQMLNQAEGIVAMPSLAQSAPLIYYGLTLPLVELPATVPELSPLYYLVYVEDVFDPAQVGRQNLSQANYQLSKSHSYPGLRLEVYVRP